MILIADLFHKRVNVYSCVDVQQKRIAKVILLTFISMCISVF